MRTTIIAILLTFGLAACAPRTPVSLTPAPLHSATPTSAPTHTATPTSPADDIDARLTRIAQTVHPQATQTMMSTQATAEAIAAVTAFAAVPTPTLPARAPRQIYASQQLTNPSWSIDSPWINFWTRPANPYDPGTPFPGFVPMFYNAATGQACTQRDFVAIISEGNMQGYSYWLPEGRVVITLGDQSFIGEPCGTFEPAPVQYTVSPALWRLSPDARYRAEVGASDATSNDEALLVTITDAQTGVLLNEVEWLPSYSIEGLSFQWVGNRYLLLTRSADRGPLLIEVGSPEVIDVMADLFRVEDDYSNWFPQIEAYGQEVAATGEYHLLLDIPGRDFVRHMLMLYHSETDSSQLLQFEHKAWVQGPRRGLPAFTPDGEWLLLVTSVSQALEGDDGSIWLRAIDGTDDGARRIGRMFSLMPAPSGDRVAYIEFRDSTAAAPGVVIASFPAFAVQSHWLAAGYVLNPFGWSPDGTMLLAQGSTPDHTSEDAHVALFLIEP